MSDITLLLLLILAHLLGDFYLQPNTWVECRTTHHVKSPSLYKHAGVHGVLTLLVLLLLSPTSLLSCIILAAFILICHLIIDLLKSYLKSSLRWFLFDQVLHILCLIAVWGWLSSWSLDTVMDGLTSILSEKVIIVALAYISCAKPASIIINLILEKWTPHLNTDRATQSYMDKPAVSLESAGKTIGYLERWLIVSFILLDQFSGIGFLLAAKSVFRFNDLSNSKDMKLTEYIMLGTLSSVTMALAVGLLTVYTLQ